MRDASNRHAIFSWLYKYQPAIICLSETHLIKERVHLIHRPCIDPAYHCTYSAHIRGVSILIHRPIPFSCIKSVVDPEGRYVYLLCNVYTLTLILVAISIPPPYWGETLKKILSFLDASPRAPFLLIGDFQNYLHPYWDRLHSGTLDIHSQPTSLSRLLEEVGIRDLWRLDSLMPDNSHSTPLHTTLFVG